MIGKKESRVVMVPWLAFGHMIPFLELSIALAKSSIHVSFISTPRNIQTLTPKIPPNLSQLIHLVPIPLPNPDPSNPLPQNAEATVDFPADKIDLLKIAFDLMQQPIKHFIAQNSPDWIMLDVFPHWLADLTIPLIFCSTNVFFGPPEFLTGDGQKKFRSTPESVASPPPWVNFPSKVAYTIEEAGFVQHGFFGVNASGISDSARKARVIGASRAIAIRSCPELEADYLQLFSTITGKPVIPVGLLPPPEEPPTTIVKQEPWSGVFSWLDRQSPATVVFVGFGSETKLSRAEIHEIAYGVELSGMPFLWSLRLPAGDDDLDSALPPGFRSRTGERGVVEVGWAPQREILAHPSIVGSFFHAGWGSIIEALQFGHVLIFLPLILDQPLNARLLADKGLGIEVRRNRDGSLSRDKIADGIREAMLSDQRRARARLAAHDVFGDYDLHRGYANKFADYLKNGGLNAN